MSRRWAAVLDRAADRSGEEWRIALDGGAIRFVAAADGRGPGISGVDVRAADRPRALARARERGLDVRGDEIALCGTRFRLL